VSTSDRTDLSTESGLGPIQLAWARYRTARRSVAELPPHCISAPQRTLQAKKRGKIGEKWEYTVGIWNDVWLNKHHLQIRASDIEVHNGWLNFHSWTSRPSFIARWSYRITHRVVRTAAKLNILFTARRLKARPSARAASQLTHVAWENVTTDVIRGGSLYSDRPWTSVRERLYNIYYTDVHATDPGHPLCLWIAAVQTCRWLAEVAWQVMAREFNWPGRVGGSLLLLVCVSFTIIGQPPSTSLGNSGLCWTVFARNSDTAVPAEGNGDLQTLICVLAARPRRCLVLSNPVPWQNWMAAYLGYTLRMRTLFRGWPIMVNDTHTRRRSTLYCCNGAQRYERAVLTGQSAISGFDLAWFSSLSSDLLCISDLHGSVYIVNFFSNIFFFTF